MLYSIVNRATIYSFLSDKPLLLKIVIIALPVLLLINAVILLGILAFLAIPFIEERRKYAKEFGIIWKHQNQCMDIVSGEIKQGNFAIAYCPDCGQEFDVNVPNGNNDQAKVLYCNGCEKDIPLINKGKEITYFEAVYKMKKKFASPIYLHSLTILKGASISFKRLLKYIFS